MNTYVEVDQFYADAECVWLCDQHQPDHQGDPGMGSRVYWA